MATKPKKSLLEHARLFQQHLPQPEVEVNYARMSRAASAYQPTRKSPSRNGLFKNLPRGILTSPNVNTNNEMFRKKTNGINRLRSTFQNPILSTHIVTLNSTKEIAINKLNAYKKLIEDNYFGSFGTTVMNPTNLYGETVEYIKEWIQFIDNIKNTRESINNAILQTNISVIKDKFKKIRSRYTALYVPTYAVVVASSRIIDMFETFHDSLEELQTYFVGGRRTRRQTKNRKTMRLKMATKSL